MSPMEPITIIGTACRFAGSSSTPSKLWELLQNPKDVASEPPADRFNIEAFYDPEGSNPTTTNARQGYFLSDNVKAFDAPFFNISATEALALGPQQRMLLEVVYESLEAAGLRLDALRGSSTGVYCGVMNSDWEGIFSVLILADLDALCFLDMTESRLCGLKNLVQVAEKTLWVTAGAEAENPHLGLSKGFLTCMNYEHQPALFQYLNIIDIADVQPTVMAEHLLRLAYTTQDNDFALTTSVHSTELELRLDRGGVLLFPRINASDALNTKYAAVRRPVTQSVVDMQQEVVTINWAPDGQPRLRLGETSFSDDPNTIEVRYSTSRALRIDGGGALTLVLGHSRATLARLVALADQTASVVTSSYLWEVPHDILESQEPAFLHATASALLAATLVQPIRLSSCPDVQRVTETFRKATVTAYQLVIQSNSSSLPEGLAIVQWTPSSPVLAQVQPSSALVHLSSQKTYLLVGMTGALGRSTAHWLIGRGARHLILTSRNPQVDPAWISELQHTAGARIIAAPMDVTSRTSILSIADTIKAHWPPLGGVVNGAMILHDRRFIEAPLSLMTGQLAPKVQGSLLLDEIFGECPNLDFFILFGSAVATIGNLGQSTYTAASNFLLALAAQRRARGLVASVAQPSQVSGDIGYLADKDDKFWTRMYHTVGRLLELFAHAILTGQPGSDTPSPRGDSPVDFVIGGIRVQDPAEFPHILWYRTPKVWPFIRYHHDGAMGSSSSTTTAVPLVEQLRAATTSVQVGEIVEAGVAAKLHHRLHLPGEVGHGTVTAETRLTELGVDSLIAVDLRRWFEQELEVDIPVLQMLGGCSVRELAGTVTGLLPTKFYPEVLSGGSDDGSQSAISSGSSSFQVVSR